MTDSSAGAPERDPAPGAFAELAGRAESRHVVVIGAGIAGLVAALECAKVGAAVTVLERDAHAGGTVRSVEVGGSRLDAAVEGWRTSDAVRALAAELGLADELTDAADGDVWLAGPSIPGGAAPLPRDAIVGVPANPWDERVRRLIGWSGTWRAYVDRIRPPLTIGQERRLGALVRSRMGAAVHDRLVAPLTSGAYGLAPDDVDVEGVAPGLSKALTRRGSLSGAVAELVAARPAGSGITGLEGGTWRLVDALLARLAELGADVRFGAAAATLARDGDRWRVTVAPARDRPAGDRLPGEDAAAVAAPGSPSGETPAESLVADAVIVAAPETHARALLDPVVPALSAAPAPIRHDVEVVTLVAAAPALAAHPRRLVHPAVPRVTGATAVCDSTARWPWLARRHPSVRILRVQFGTGADAAATRDLDDAAAVDLARQEASVLLGIALDDVRGGTRVRLTAPRPASALGATAGAHAARTAVSRLPGLAIVGAWPAGSGLAHVVPDAQQEADRVRRNLLWG